MSRVLAALTALLFALVALALAVWMIDVSDLARCEDREAFLASGEDDCIEGSAAERAIGLILGYGATLTAILTAAFGLSYAARRRHGRPLVAAALATPLLALAALVLLPVSF